MNHAVELVSRDDDPVRRAKQDPAAFGELYESYFSRIYNFMRYRVSDPTAADDLTSQTFLRALDRLDTFDRNYGSFATWLFAIARNAVRDHQRTRRRRRLVSLEWIRARPDPSPPPDAQVEGDERREQLLAAIGTLPERDREILGLRFGGGMTNRAIAEMTGWTESNVGVIVYRAVRRLRDELTKGEADHE